MGLLNETAQQYYQNNNYGNYQFTSLNDIISNFLVSYVGEDKIISKIKRADVAFHAQRALQELSFDTFKSCKTREITVPNTLQMILPQDYVNYVKLTWSDSSGVEHVIYPTSKTSNPFRPQVDSNDDFIFHNDELLASGNIIKNGNFMGGSDSWDLNIDGTGGTATYSVLTSTTAATFGDPTQGWFYGWDGNAIRGYDVQTTSSVVQTGVPIMSGEDYKITYTISSYTSGSFQFTIVDENGDYTSTTERTADGTYTETITAGGTAAAYPTQSIYFFNNATADGNAIIDSISIVKVNHENSSETSSKYKSIVPSENNTDDYQDDTYWPINGERYGLDPQHAQVNGSYFIDCNEGKIHFSSNLSGKTMILEYISDSLGTDEEMKVHKFAEEAIYKWIAYGILSARPNIPEYIIQRYKKERFAETRKAKLRLSNIKLEEITQIFRGKSKQIKH